MGPIPNVTTMARIERLRMVVAARRKSKTNANGGEALTQRIPCGGNGATRYFSCCGENSHAR
jgi:hypothetical protein